MVSTTDFKIIPESVNLKGKTAGVDACILLRIGVEEDEKEYCARCITKSSYVFQAVSTGSILGEILYALCTKVEDMNLRAQFIEWIRELIKTDRLKIIRPDINRDSRVAKLKATLAGWVPNDDIIHLSNLMVAGVKIFITLDTPLLNNRKTIQEKFGMQILHPAEIQ